MYILDKYAIIERLKNFRESRDLSARQFAVDADIDQSHYSKVENGKMPVTEKMLLKFFKRYADLDKDYILYGKTGDTIYEGFSSGMGQQAVHQGSYTGVHNIENNVIEVVNSLISLAPPVNPVLPPQQQIHHFKDRESKLLMAIDLLKAAIGNLQNEVDQFQHKDKNREAESY